MTIENLEAEAVKLDPEERVRLAEKLLGSVPLALEFEEEWAAEVDLRIEEIRGGRAKLVSSEDMFREALESLE